jgi:hypothetical protein
VRKNLGAVALWLVAGCGGALPEVSHPPAPVEAAPIVQVDRTTLLISFPPQAGADVAWPEQRLPAGYPGPEWRAMIRAVEALLLVLSLQLVPDSTQSLGPYASTSEALTHAQLRECDLGQHIIACPYSLNGEAVIEGRELVLRIRDRSLIARLKAHRHLHPSARLDFRRNQQEIAWQGIVYLEYQ